MPPSFQRTDKYAILKLKIGRYLLPIATAEGSHEVYEDPLWPFFADEVYKTCQGCLVNSTFEQFKIDSDECS